MFSRRDFLKRFGIGVAAACALASLPEAAVQALTLADAGRRCACEFLRTRYNDHMRGRTASETPLSMRVPSGLFAAFEGELFACERFIASDARQVERPHSLMFKGTMLFADPAMPAAWDVRFQEKPAPGRAYAMNTTGALVA